MKPKQFAILKVDPTKYYLLRLCDLPCSVASFEFRKKREVAAFKNHLAVFLTSWGQNSIKRLFGFKTQGSRVKILILDNKTKKYFVIFKKNILNLILLITTRTNNFSKLKNFAKVLVFKVVK